MLGERRIMKKTKESIQKKRWIKMTVFRRFLSLCLIGILTLSSGFQIARLNGFPSAVQNAGCLGVSTRALFSRLHRVVLHIQP